MAGNKEARELVLLGRAEKALEEAKTIDEIQDLRDKAQAARAYARKAKLGQRIVVEASALKVRAERKLGEVLRKLPLAKGSQGNQHSKVNSDHLQHVNGSVTLDELGVSYWDSARSQKLAALPKGEFNRYVDQSVKEVREPTTTVLLRMAKQHEAVERTKERPRSVGYVTNLRSLTKRNAKFGTTYADPPWPYRNKTARGASNNHYPSMSIEDICKEPVAKLVGTKAHLHLWATAAFLKEALCVMEAWGFTYKSQFVWVKPEMGAGNYWRVSHEILLFGDREVEMSHQLLLFGQQGGEPFLDNGVKSWGEYPRRKHSQKPEEIRALIEEVSPGPFLEMYGRGKRQGWTAYGNQVG